MHIGINERRQETRELFCSDMYPTKHYLFIKQSK